jgi:hypothetical protein
VIVEGTFGTPFSTLTHSLWVDDAVVWEYQLNIPQHGLQKCLPPSRVLFDATESIPWRKRGQGMIDLL